MNWILSIPALFQNLGSLSSVVPLIQKYFSGAANADDMQKAIDGLPAIVVKALEYIGSQRFPALAPQLHAIAVITTSFHSDRTAWFQEAYNKLYPNEEPLEVDGVSGPKTDAAVLKLQARLGLPADGWLGKMTADAISKLLNDGDPAPSTVLSKVHG